MPSDATPPEPPPLPLQQRRWQFSLRTLMALVTGVALLCGLASVLPIAFSQALIGLAWLAATGWLVTGLFFAHGDQRAFCIGAVIVLSSTWTGIGGRFLQGVYDIFGQTFAIGELTLMSQAPQLWIKHVILATAAVANGRLCIRARGYFERTGN